MTIPDQPIDIRTAFSRPLYDRLVRHGVTTIELLFDDKNLGWMYMGQKPLQEVRCVRLALRPNAKDEAELAILKMIGRLRVTPEYRANMRKTLRTLIHPYIKAV